MNFLNFLIDVWKMMLTHLQILIERKTLPMQQAIATFGDLLIEIKDRDFPDRAKAGEMIVMEDQRLMVKKLREIS